jgi:formamidopyrimidine-DNA glycosylase
MPELPEVETIVRQLRQPVMGRLFTDVRVLWDRTVATGVDELRQRLPGQRVESINRRGKYLVFHLSAKEFLLIHLKMTGDLQVCDAGEVLHPHDRVVFSFDDGYELRFRDMRKFGRIYLTGDLSDVVGRLGPEPLDSQFTGDDFLALFAKRSGRVKSLLLNQNFLAGLGNIYADESLFLAGIHPERRVNSLSDDEKRALYRAIRDVLAAAINHKGSSLPDEAYRGGGYQQQFLVYGREGASCSRCGASIERIRLNQRSAHFCPECQR